MMTAVSASSLWFSGPLIAVKRAFAVLSMAATLFGCWIAMLIVGPTVEASVSPVIKDVSIEPLPNEDNGAIAFYVKFTKTRGCENGGRQWYAVLPDGRLQVIQAQYPDWSDPPVSRPPGMHRGAKTVLVPPVEAVGIYATQLHKCSMPWGTSRSGIGPFPLADWDHRARGKPFPLELPEPF